ncbi:mannosyltransferase PMTI [Talaromyces proteolyticus]|uniref:Dolichyl-phosphate-mannose--protein mannosyltransferase n=1 Tax=Talaromyces proteolyticus TaxID=1131652 RepID=A0AAD4KXM1_9EURO|nr:mannosyltransferase PMTI [Talaromyces proteolyticus]KAH8701072.1 mannosyltransferase PMTI [Talaromyces proteolyticus]
MSSPASLRKRGGGKRDVTEPQPSAVAPKPAAASSPAAATAKPPSEWDYWVALVVVTALAFGTRFWNISYPDEVVFDEVHFGKFASYYLQRSYFFDVHPPFGKLLFAFVGWLVGYDGNFTFDNIGESYIDNKVPYIAYRALPATLGSLTIPVVFDIMWESGYSLPACVLAAGLMVFDNAHIGEDRLILLDACLVLSMALSILCYVKFYKQRHNEFSRKWWKWLLLTGISLSCVISTKYVGVFTFVTIGSAVAIDLWNLLDIKRPRGTMSLLQFGHHFAARAFALIIVPFFFYLFWFQVHFAVLTKSGPGDDFMTPEFQATLAENALTSNAVDINYFDEIVIRHKDTKVYLHSHFDQYPLRYDDGRISSQGQQVTGYPFNDTNNVWQILPSAPLPENDGAAHVVKNGDHVRLRHIVTDSILLTHDVASPLMPTNQEFTTVTQELADGERHADTLFEIKIENGKPGQEFRSLASLFKLIHVPTRVAMWTHPTPLPDWAYKQAEINGNKNSLQSSNIWYVEEIPSIPEGSPRLEKEEREVQKLSFVRKWAELQRAMFFHNNALTSEHPYASEPFQWPFMLRGVSFWTKNDTREQIYFLGNPIGWWFASSLLSVFVGIIGADQLSLRRGIDAIEEIWGPGARSRLYNSTGFLFLCWAAHYFPFWLMGRQRFLHHYLPAHLASCLVAAALVEFIASVDPIPPASTDLVYDPKDKTKPPTVRRFRTAKERLGLRSLLVAWAATGVIMAAVVYSFLFYAPLTYGTPGLDPDGVNARKWLDYDLHFAK